MPSIAFTATATTDITPKFTFSGENITWEVNAGGTTAFVSGAAPTIGVILGDTITYTTDGDWSGVTGLFFNSDKVSGDVSQFSPFISVSSFTIPSTLIFGNLSDVSNVTAVVFFDVRFSSVTADSGCLDTQVLMTALQASSCNWTQQEVDNCLESLVVNEVAGSSARDCDVNIEGTNADPSYNGYVYARKLLEAGWTLDITVPDAPVGPILLFDGAWGW